MEVLAFLLLFGCVANVAAHLCLLNPRQRGSMTGINSPNATDCRLFTRMGECGGRVKSSNHVSILRRGMNYTVIFQKNLDHHNTTHLGSYDVSLYLENTGGHFRIVLASVMDTAAPSLTLYQVDVLIPLFLTVDISPEYVLEVTYNSNTVPVTFIQCADILLI